MITLYKFLQSGLLPQIDIIELPHLSKTPTLALATSLAEKLYGNPQRRINSIRIDVFTVAIAAVNV